MINRNTVTSLKISSDGSGNIGISGSEILFARVTSGIATVTARIPGSSQDNATKVIQIIAGNLDLQTVSGGTPTTGGVPGGFRKDPFVVRALANGSPISGQIVKFTITTSEGNLAPVPGTRVFLANESTTSLAAADNNNSLLPATNIVSTILREEQYTKSDGNPIENDTPIFVETDAQGEAKVYLKMGTTAGASHTVRAQLPVGNEFVDFTVKSKAGNIAARLQKIDVPDKYSDDSERETLAVRVENLDGDPLPGVNIRWTTTDDGTISYRSGHGTLSDRAARVSTDSGFNGISSGEEIFVRTDDYGEVWVTYLKDEDKSKQSVRSEIASEQGGQQYDFEIRLVTFNIGGTTTTQPTQTTTTTTTTTTTPTDDDPEPDEIEIVSGNDQTGSPGSTLSEAFVVRVIDDAGDPVENVRVYFDIDSGGGSVSRRSQRTDDDGEAETTLTLGSSPGENKVTATLDDDDLDVDDIEFTATAIAQPEKIEIVSGNNQTGSPNRALSEAFVVKVTDANGNPVEDVTVVFRVRSGPGRFPGGVRITETTNSRGEADSQRLALTSNAFGTVRVTAEVGGAGSVEFTVNAGDPPDALVSVSGNNQTGVPESKLKAPFVVEVLDKDDNPMSGITVTFRVTAGGGKVSPTSASTNSSGRAQTTLTLGSKLGENTVTASVAGLSRTVTFKAKAGAVVVMDASDRAPLYWIDGTKGTLHRLVGDEVEDLSPKTQGVTCLAVDSTNGLLYFGVLTKGNVGDLRRSTLSGQNVQTLKSGIRVPSSITVDAAGGTLYWTASNGKIKSMPAGGAQKAPNVQQGLTNPTGIALSNGYLYWAESRGSISRLSLTQSKPKVENIATGLGAPISTGIARGKIYWMEVSSAGTGSLHRANVDGTKIEKLKSFQGSPPTGLSVDSSARKLYWTKADKVRRASLNGKFIKDVVTGLMSPGGIAVGTAAPADTTVVEKPTQQTTQQPKQTTQQTTSTTTDSTYDVNGDGVVNQGDVDTVVLAVAFKSSDTKYDINGDGAVNAMDIVAITAQVEGAAAAPPTDVDVTLLDVEVLHEQIALLLASGDRSVAAKQTLAYLQHLLTLARPSETVLLANYPNPFNPETWIPYHLASATDVRINIYDAQGRLVRALTLGHQTAGYYTHRSRAAYWDGRNAFGEQVASGIYFYQLQTEEMSSLRKMVILK